MAATSQDKEKFYDYEGFIEKFKPKLTTDDCYTPPIVYQAVADWVADNYGVEKESFARPFYPGGDYECADYSAKIVVDNPPFSILSKIIKFYVEKGIRFFLFAPTLSGLVQYSDVCTALPVGVDVTYENGAKVMTSFVTNMEPHEIRMKTAPTLYDAVKKANDKNRKKLIKIMPKYSYPLELVTSAAIYPYSKYGIEFLIPRAESVRVSRLDAQQESRKSIFGRGLLISNRLTAEREKAEREKAQCFPLSSRERDIISKLCN